MSKSNTLFFQHNSCLQCMPGQVKRNKQPQQYRNREYPPIVSANAPWNGGIIAPPRIIMIRNADPSLVYFPKSSNCQRKNTGPHYGTEQATTHKCIGGVSAVCQHTNRIAIVARTDKCKQCFCGFFLSIKNTKDQYYNTDCVHIKIGHIIASSPIYQQHNSKSDKRNNNRQYLFCLLQIEN